MALLQISEPGETHAPHQRKLAVGIDLGTTFSLVATIRHGLPEVLADKKGRVLLPSAIRYLKDGAVQTGYAALAAQSCDPKNTITSVKRFMGRGLKDIPYAENLPYDFHDTPGMVSISTAGGTKSPVEVSAKILTTLRKRAEESLAGDIEGAVITVPAYFDEAQRQATKDAAKLAGLKVLRLLSEPTAAAIAYGLDQKTEGIFAVYDLGGGTFDISILKLSKGIFEVLATGGDSALGGDDFDHRLFCWIIESAELNPLSSRDMRTLMVKAREVKEQLSSADQVQISETLESNEVVQLTITNLQLSELTHHLVDKTLSAVKKTFRDARLLPHEIDGVVLVGGATRMPHVRKAVEALFQSSPYTGLNPDQVVALGAAIQANMLIGNLADGEDWLLLDVIPLSLGVETMGGLVEKIIPRNSTIPCARAQEFTTFKEGQTALAVHVLQGEREMASACRSLARFELHGIPPMVAGAAKICITYQVDADGLLSVSARELQCGVEATITVKPSYGLSNEEITKMLTESNRAAQSDMKERALREERIEAERLIEVLDRALASDGDLLDAAELANIHVALDTLRKQHEKDDHLAIRAACTALSTASESFAERRMNRSIKAALSGKSLDQIT